ncbi:hypothetical protein [Candidatus Palauibacter sp.]|uniref:hypothetical protein n=1 Tax=Candidatus Palauibacter sp. TaxID=3101350 RepID=UPI003CC5D3D1
MTLPLQAASTPGLQDIAQWAAVLGGLAGMWYRVAAWRTATDLTVSALKDRMDEHQDQHRHEQATSSTTRRELYDKLDGVKTELHAISERLARMEQQMSPGGPGR